MAHTHAPAPSTSVNPAAHQRRLIATLTVTGSVFLIEVVSAVLTDNARFFAHFRIPGLT